MKLYKKIIYLTIILSINLFGQFSRFHDDISDKCDYCHIKESDSNNIQTTIWQQNVNNNYIPYSSATLDANMSVPLGSSKLCLSCHDGVISHEHFNLELSTNQILGNNLKSSHPVSFKYDSYLAIKDGELFDPQASPSGLGGTISSDLLVDGNLECISCHDVHGMSKQKNLLVVSNQRSRLCLTCHKK